MCARWVPVGLRSRAYRGSPPSTYGGRRTDRPRASRLGRRQHHDVGRGGCRGDNGESVICFDAPGHGVSPGSQATITEYANAIVEVLQRFPSIQPSSPIRSRRSPRSLRLPSPATGDVRAMLLLAPTCSLSGVLDRWAAQTRPARPAWPHWSPANCCAATGFRCRTGTSGRSGYPRRCGCESCTIRATSRCPSSDSHRICCGNPRRDTRNCARDRSLRNYRQRPDASGTDHMPASCHTRPPNRETSQCR